MGVLVWRCMRMIRLRRGAFVTVETGQQVGNDNRSILTRFLRFNSRMLLRTPNKGPEVNYPSLHTQDKCGDEPTTI